MLPCTPPIPVPEVTIVPWAAYELASISLERQRSLEDREPLTFDFSTIDLSKLELAGLV